MIFEFENLKNKKFKAKFEVVLETVPMKYGKKTVQKRTTICSLYHLIGKGWHDLSSGMVSCHSGDDYSVMEGMKLSLSKAFANLKEDANKTLLSRQDRLNAWKSFFQLFDPKMAKNVSKVNPVRHERTNQKRIMVSYKFCKKNDIIHSVEQAPASSTADIHLRAHTDFSQFDGLGKVDFIHLPKPTTVGKIKVIKPREPFKTYDFEVKQGHSIMKDALSSGYDAQRNLDGSITVSKKDNTPVLDIVEKESK